MSTAAVISAKVIAFLSNKKNRNGLIAVCLGIVAFMVLISSLFISLIATFIIMFTGQSFHYPMPNHTYVSSPFGSDRNISGTVEAHYGTDFPAPEGTLILAPASGTVILQNSGNSSGIMMTLEHEGGYRTTYRHLSEYLCEVGQTVIAGTPIALSGNTGFSTGPHLHFEISLNSEFLDPETVLEDWPEGYLNSLPTSQNVRVIYSPNNDIALSFLSLRTHQPNEFKRILSNIFNIPSFFPLCGVSAHTHLKSNPHCGLLYCRTHFGVSCFILHLPHAGLSAA